MSSRYCQRLKRKAKRRQELAARRGFRPTTDVDQDWNLGRPILPVRTVPRPR